MLIPQYGGASAGTGRPQNACLAAHIDDRLMGDGFLTLLFQASGDLRGAPVLPQ